MAIMWCKSYHSEHSIDAKLIAIEQGRNLLYCHNNSCKCVDHRNSIDVFCNSIIECCLCVSTSTIPQTKPGVRKMILGWNDLATQEREQSLFWH